MATIGNPGMRGGARQAPQSKGNQSMPVKGNASVFNGVQIGVPPTKPSHPSIGGKVNVIGSPTKIVAVTSGSKVPARHSPDIDSAKMLSK